ncbi:MAG: hypothetical protein H6853_04230 [Rhodospirillales bacterium]|nr:hypothetical protein [Alphaproteobacteria bacterium]USO04479.1 MAG: hypothetical protein H6853_04230 [Rhodospirillales bacterium]
MTQQKETPAATQSKADLRAAALRENLKKRKNQAKERQDDGKSQNR